MSRIGLKPLPLPTGVTLTIAGAQANVKGPKGTLHVPVAQGIAVALENGTAKLSRRDNSGSQRALHGLTRALLANAVLGVSKGYERVLEIVGVGYRAEATGNAIKLSLGYSHPVEFHLPQGISVRVEEKNTVLVLSGIDKQLLGQVCADLRALRPPDNYKGKGVRYRGEHILIKPGKAAGK